MAFSDLSVLASTASFVKFMEELKTSNRNVFFQLGEIDQTTDRSIQGFVATMDAFYKLYPIGVPGNEQIKVRINAFFKKEIRIFLSLPHEEKLLYRSPEHYVWKEVPVPFWFFHNSIMRNIPKMMLPENVSPFSY
jgi:hypothetical protein